MLKAAEETWEQERIHASNDNMAASIEAEGRVPIIYEPAELPAILPRVEGAVFADRRNDLVLTHTQGLLTVCEKRPITVREVIRENGSEASDVPLGLLIGRYGQHELGLRLMASCAFLKATPSGYLIEIAAPPKLVHTMLEVSHNTSPCVFDFKPCISFKKALGPPSCCVPAARRVSISVYRRHRDVDRPS